MTLDDKMIFESKNIEEIYEGKVAKHYDRSMSHFFGRYKKSAFEDSSMGNGDKVLVFCCGTGLDFPHISKRIGNDGLIVGVDFSSGMLRKAEEKIKDNNWENIELVHADITEFKDNQDRLFDVGVCTLGMSIIPEYKQAYYNLCSNIKKHGEIVIGDMQLASGWLALLNPLTIFMAKKYGGTKEGHQNSLKLRSLMKNELTNVRQREFFYGSYYYCIGNTR
jgi:ubiquinone/menaquinone biosynthesis C-methylase UbiE